MRIERVGNNPSTYNTDSMTIEEATAKYGQTNDSIQLYDDNGNLVAYSVWKQGYNHYSFCRHPSTSVAPCDWDVLR